MTSTEQEQWWDDYVGFLERRNKELTEELEECKRKFAHMHDVAEMLEEEKEFMFSAAQRAREIRRQLNG